MLRNVQERKLPPYPTTVAMIALVGNFSITAGKPADVELGRGLPREQRSGLTKE
jgi:hypothetical protein